MLFTVPTTLLNCLGCCTDCCCLLTIDDDEVDLRQSTELELELLVEALFLVARKKNLYIKIIYVYLENVNLTIYFYSI